MNQHFEWNRCNHCQQWINDPLQANNTADGWTHHSCITPSLTKRAASDFYAFVAMIICFLGVLSVLWAVTK